MAENNTGNKRKVKKIRWRMRAKIEKGAILNNLSIATDRDQGRLRSRRGNLAHFHLIFQATAVFYRQIFQD